jgi:hypothetical protein
MPAHLTGALQTPPGEREDQSSPEPYGGGSWIWGKLLNR